MTASIKHVIVGTAGHIDHGKSALVEALTGRIRTAWQRKSGAASLSTSALRS